MTRSDRVPSRGRTPDRPDGKRPLASRAPPVPPVFAGPHQDIVAPPRLDRARPRHRNEAEYDAIMAILLSRFSAQRLLTSRGAEDHERSA